MNIIKKYLDMPNDSRQKTIAVALVLCLVCSVFVSAAAVILKPMQEANKLLDKRRNILQIAGLMEEGKSIDELFSKIEAKVIDLQTGEYVTDIDPETFDARAAAVDPKQNVVLDKEQDIASIKRHAKYATVYLVREGDQVKKAILPVYGYGLWSTLYGFLALESDFNTVVGLGFYEHAETPGLGGEVDNPNWKSLWAGKKIFNDNGEVAITLQKGGVTADTPGAVNKVDALSGATLTSNGVSNLLKFWLGENGLGPYLNKARNGGA